MDPYADIAAYYDCEHGEFGADIDFYLDSLEPCAILEVGAGTGRVMAPLAEAGFEVWGVEPSEAMLNRARPRLAQFSGAHLIKGTLSDIHRTPRFDAVLFTLNALWHFPSFLDQMEALVGARHLLLPGGRVIVDCTNPLNMADKGGNGSVRLRYLGPCESGTLAVQSAAWDDPVQQELLLRLMYDWVSSDGRQQRATSEIVLRYIYLGELGVMLRHAGCESTEFIGWYDREPYSESSPNLTAVATFGR